ncbi:GTP-binding protein [Rubritalea squalenifaciens DSM 18772]|uniref:GTPase Der n=1 Tax=Rubritalea squalenifaciens DSM 18772 TaxID=1123071 RepID=A0A1M6JBS1_9BACT|nr:ribosome biogenesis GTPase Der [Rubritalea squalenifaciens]SHJ44186.1 GTP-binding protein [Rubritalea squalenifaciens DSM 18772]
MPTIAIVGRPNVGKSALFNRLAQRRIAIVHDQPGVTRDRIAAPCVATEHPCTIIDTGGIGATLDDGFADQVTIEADIAMETADAILFVVDARDGLTPIDEALAQKLRRAKPPVHLVLNKADHTEQELMVGDFAKLGFGAGLPVSAAHGRGISELTELIDSIVGPLLEREAEEKKEAEEIITRDGLKIAIVGKPNAGKSSLINAILKDERTIVSEIAGTTRDAIDIPYEYAGERHTLIDTAGLRPRQKMDTSVEVFSAQRTEKSIRRADICLLVVDLAAGISAMDRKIAQLIKEERKPCLIILNKWDLYHPGGNRKDRLEEAEEQIRTDLFFLAYAPFAAVSAKEGQHISQIFSQISKIREAARNPVTTGRLNKLLQDAFTIKPPGQHKKYKKRVKLLYATAVVNDKYTAIPVPQFILFVNDKRLMHEHYEQYLANRIREKHHIPGIPVVFSIRSRNKSKTGSRTLGDLTEEQ